jgi:hypothetical protein
LKRSRVIGAAPKRSASETWSAISSLITDTLSASSDVNMTEVEDALDAANGAGRALVAAGHLDSYPLVLVAPPVHLTITTVSGSPALQLDDPTAVPGGASATEWMIYLPAPEPLHELVVAATATNDRLSAEEAPAESETVQSASIDRAAIARLIQRDSK